MRRGLKIGFLLGVAAALVGRILSAEDREEQWAAARSEAALAASQREAELRARHAAARREGRLPDDSAVEG